MLLKAFLLLSILSFSLTVLPKAKSPFISLNPLIDVGDNRLVQHDENNNTIYDLKKSGTGMTTVYELIHPEFQANKVWTNKGTYIDNVVTRDDGVTFIPHGATAPEDFIPVIPGEEYFLRTYGVGYVGAQYPFWYAPVVFLDENDTFVKDALTNTVSKSKAGVVVTVPEKAAKMHLTMFGQQDFTIQKVINVTDEEFDRLTVNRTKLEAEINATYNEYKKDKTLYKKLDKAYITIVNDDTRSPMDQFANVFIERNFPMVLATIPSLLIENASSQKETRLQVCRRIVQAGGEILAHNDPPLTKEGMSDYNTMYSMFVKPKQILESYGFDVNGIILSGGVGQVVGAEESERWSSSIYSYSDLYGQEYTNKDIAMDHVYFHWREGMLNYKNDINALIKTVNEAVEQKIWKVFYFHDTSEVTTDTIRSLINYIYAVGKDKIEPVTYKQMYEKFAEKESIIKNTVHTYYVSSTGTSSSGTDIADPMSLEEANKKTYISGDTILFKRGDTFYGTFAPKIAQVNNKVTTVSDYGEGELPTFSAYKIVDHEGAWLPFSYLYQIHLKQVKNFAGLQYIDDNSSNIGFIEISDGTKLYNKKSCLSELADPSDFYNDGTFLYMKTNTDPYKTYGTMKLATRNNLMILHSNMRISNLRFVGTGAHAMVGSDAETVNLKITNCVISDVGGSYLKGTTRYGNGIELYSTNANLVEIRNNIIKNVYDVGFTMQGIAGSARYVNVRDNVFISNSQDSEIWESEKATGIESYVFSNNLSINQGRGWGYLARPDKYVAGHVLFWGYTLTNTDIYFHHNIVYNPRRIYFIEQTHGTNVFFKENEYIKSDYNRYLMGEDATIYRDAFKVGEKENFIAEYNKDKSSEFKLIVPDEDVISFAVTSEDIDAIRSHLKSG